MQDNDAFLGFLSLLCCAVCSTFTTDCRLVLVSVNQKGCVQFISVWFATKVKCHDFERVGKNLKFLMHLLTVGP